MEKLREELRKLNQQSAKSRLECPKFQAINKEIRNCAKCIDKKSKKAVKSIPAHLQKVFLINKRIKSEIYLLAEETAKILEVSREDDKTITYQIQETGEKRTIQLTNGETDPDQGKISRISPLGMALSNKNLGEIAEQNYIIKVENLTKHYQNKKVLGPINFNIKKGEKVAIIGANGSGKTTLCEIIANLKNPTHGKIKYGFPSQKLGNWLSINFQEQNYPSTLIVQDLINFYHEVYKSNQKQSEL
ncbi:10666_t:CDS:2 [Ambispora leptoticha]|uniref:10666_t:CDS:1 n=1 Tax=Ambispora leptoticha TaxID=144679 RepID=A0A9N9NFY8_9GLOM|nr:10666_t:CDS:2 [Ambispora leptoticha]